MVPLMFWSVVVWDSAPRAYIGPCYKHWKSKEKIIGIVCGRIKHLDYIFLML